jgi:hypothetical protein
MTLTCGKKTSKKHGCISSPRILKMTVIVYDNKNLHITELEDTRPVFILFYLAVIKYNDPAVGETDNHCSLALRTSGNYKYLIFD